MDNITAKTKKFKVSDDSFGMILSYICNKLKGRTKAVKLIKIEDNTNPTNKSVVGNHLAMGIWNAFTFFNHIIYFITYLL